MTATDRNSLSSSEVRLEKGRATFEASLGASTAAFQESVDAQAPGYGRLILEWEFADAYGRPGLDLRTRELIVVATCATLGALGVAAEAISGIAGTP